MRIRVFRILNKSFISRERHEPSQTRANLSIIIMREKLLQKAKEFIFSPLEFEWTKTELVLVNKVFTNSNGRVFFIYNQLPANMIAVLMAIYSRMKNKRGLRGTFVDSFVPNILSSFIDECQSKYDGNQIKFLKENQLNKLDKFINYSAQTKEVYQKFVDSLNDPKYLESLSRARKMKNFLSMWLDKYGHNSIARPAMLYFCLEQVSALAVKSVEWTRPGAGYIELSTRYVDMHGKDVYPAHQGLEEFGLQADEVKEVIDESFKIYRELQGEKYNGPLPSFFREKYQNQIPENKLEMGVIGETCDVLGNALPGATLSSVGVGMSGESLPSMIQHLQLDGTPENLAIVEMIMQEAEKIGADQFLRHLEFSDWKKADWEYLKEKEIKESNIPDVAYVEKVLLEALKQKKSFADCQNWLDVINKLKSFNRTDFDKLPREFELVTTVFNNTMSYRSWRDLQRMGLCMHRRSYITPTIGFYQYDKPAPEILAESFKQLYQLNQKLYIRMSELNVPPELMQYPMAMGNLVNFTIAGNLRQMEFCNWQRSKPTVNHEVRQIFLWTEAELRNKLPWWQDISRADTTVSYIFARGDSDVPLN